MGPKPKRNESETDDTPTMFQKILAELKQLNTRIDSMEDRFGKIEEKFSGIEDSINFHVREVEELKSQLSDIKSKFPSTLQKVQELESQMLHKSVEIQGIPHDSNESLKELFLKLSELKKLKLTMDNVDVIYRNRTKRSVNIRFLQSHVKQSFIAAFKGRDNQVTAKDLGYRSCTDAVFVNELLSYENRRLFFLTRKFKKEHDYAYAWTIDQKIFLRKTQESQAILIKKPDDLSDLE